MFITVKKVIVTEIIASSHIIEMIIGIPVFNAVQVPYLRLTNLVLT